MQCLLGNLRKYGSHPQRMSGSRPMCQLAMSALGWKRSLQRDPFDENVERSYQTESCVRVKIVGFLNRFWTRLTDRGFFALGITVGAFATILVFIATGKMPDWLQRVLSHEERIAEWLMVVFTISAFFILLATLKTTREVGNAQVSAYISLNVTNILIEEKSLFLLTQKS
jgi:hypothetical protein